MLHHNLLATVLFIYTLLATCGHLTSATGRYVGFFEAEGRTHEMGEFVTYSESPGRSLPGTPNICDTDRLQS